METLNNPRGPSDPTADAPRWLILNRQILKDSGASVADAKTTAASCTSSGLPFSVSVSTAAPPEASSFHYNLLGGEGTTPSSDYNIDFIQLQIVAAHDDSVLIQSSVPTVPRRTCVEFDYFLYEAGAGRKPSLFLLPGCYISTQIQRVKGAREIPTRSVQARNLSGYKNTGILRRGEGDVMVAQLEVGSDALYGTAELCVFQGGDHDWVLKRLPIVHHEGEGELQHRPEINATVPIGSRFLCWVNYDSGCIIGDMAEENPRLWFVPLPVFQAKTGHYSRNRPYCRNLAAAGPSTVRFVSIAPRCCCGGPGQTSCHRSVFAFNVTTWTLNLTPKTEKTMTWVKDGVFDSDELWQLPNYGCLPRFAPHILIVSSDNPDVVCFRVSDKNPENNTLWMVEVNTRSKVLLSGKKGYPGDLLPAKLHWF